jgi:hypothetical protein
MRSRPEGATRRSLPAPALREPRREARHLPPPLPSWSHLKASTRTAPPRRGSASGAGGARRAAAGARRAAAGRARRICLLRRPAGPGAGGSGGRRRGRGTGWPRSDAAGAARARRRRPWRRRLTARADSMAAGRAGRGTRATGVAGCAGGGGGGELAGARRARRAGRAAARAVRERMLRATRVDALSRGRGGRGRARWGAPRGLSGRPAIRPAPRPGGRRAWLGADGAQWTLWFGHTSCWVATGGGRRARRGWAGVRRRGRAGQPAGSRRAAAPPVNPSPSSLSPPIRAAAAALRPALSVPRRRAGHALRRGLSGAQRAPPPPLLPPVPPPLQPMARGEGARAAAPGAPAGRARPCVCARAGLGRSPRARAHSGTARGRAHPEGAPLAAAARPSSFIIERGRPLPLPPPHLAVPPAPTSGPGRPPGLRSAVSPEISSSERSDCHIRRCGGAEAAPAVRGSLSRIPGSGSTRTGRRGPWAGAGGGGRPPGRLGPGPGRPGGPRGRRGRRLPRAARRVAPAPPPPPAASSAARPDRPRAAIPLAPAGCAAPRQTHTHRRAAAGAWPARRSTTRTGSSSRARPA